MGAATLRISWGRLAPISKGSFRGHSIGVYEERTVFDDDDFKPKLGKIRSRGSTGGRKFLHQVLAASNLARGGAGGTRKSRFPGSRIGVARPSAACSPVPTAMPLSPTHASPPTPLLPTSTGTR